MRAQRNHIDLLTLIAVLTLMVLSLGVVYSASSSWAMEKFGESGRLLGSHATKVLLGFFAIFAVMHIDYKVYKSMTKPALLVAVVLLVVTLALGGEVKGATRFLRFGGFGLQPSEFAKLALDLSSECASRRQGRTDQGLEDRLRSADDLDRRRDGACPAPAQLQQRRDDFRAEPGHAVCRPGTAGCTSP